MHIVSNLASGNTQGQQQARPRYGGHQRLTLKASPQSMDSRGHATWHHASKELFISSSFCGVTCSHTRHDVYFQDHLLEEFIAGLDSYASEIEYVAAEH